MSAPARRAAAGLGLDDEAAAAVARDMKRPVMLDQHGPRRPRRPREGRAHQARIGLPVARAPGGADGTGPEPGEAVE